MGFLSPSFVRIFAIDIHRWSEIIELNCISYQIHEKWHKIYYSTRNIFQKLCEHFPSISCIEVTKFNWLALLTIGASDLARTETRAFLMVASVAWSIGLGGVLSLGTLLGTQPCVSDSGLSSLPTLLPLVLTLFWGEADRVLASDEEFETSLSVFVSSLGPKFRNCLGTNAPDDPISCLFSSDFPSTFCVNKIRVKSYWFDQLIELWQLAINIIIGHIIQGVKMN